MTPERWQQIKNIVSAAVARPQAERPLFVATACAGDADLRQEVESLLASHDSTPSEFLDAFPTSRIGVRIGAYRIVGELGHGGMADVFAAIRADGQYDQRVALKLVRAGHATAGLLERFRGERQILARLDHPNIARLFDGGTTPDGVPFLVMELVDGMPIDAFCNSRALTTPARLRLFLQVCAAVQYAHQRLLVHRDIKPANILVTTDGVPKLLDFGIAKLLDAGGHIEETQLRPFTPAYASPEQVRGEPVSTASDVYSLGVVLYQLLTGQSPYGAKQKTAAELTDAIVHAEATRPSQSAPDVPGLRGDLDDILLKALRKEPERRYTSVEQFAEDLRRHLDGRPVAARAGTSAYRAGKFVRRHRASVAAASLVVAALVTGIIMTAREARIAEANRKRADARFNDVRKLANSLLFEIHDSVRNLPGATDARRLILQRSVEYLDSLAKESSSEPDLVRELANGYERVGKVQGTALSSQIGDPKDALANLQKAVALRETMARTHPGNPQDRVGLASAYLSLGEFQSSTLGDATSGYEKVTRALEILDRELQAQPDDRQILATTMYALSTRALLQEGTGMMSAVGSPEQGIADLRRELGLIERATVRDPADERLMFEHGTAELTLGESLMKTGDRTGALTHFQNGITVLEPVAKRGDYFPAAYNLAVLHGKIGDVLLIDGRIKESIPHYIEDERAAARLESIDPRNETARIQETGALVEVGHALMESGRLNEGMPYLSRAVARIEADTTDSPLTRSFESLIRGWYGEALERRGLVRQASQQYALVKRRLGSIGEPAVHSPRIVGFYCAAADRYAATLVRLGDTNAASKERAEVMALLEPIVKARLNDPEVAYVLAETYTAEGTTAAMRAERAQGPADALADWQTAAAWFGKSLDTWSRVPNPAWISTSGFEVTVPAVVSARLARCEREIKSLGGEAR